MAHSHKPSAETMKIMKETPKSYVDNSEQSLFIKADISLIENDDENELIFEKPKTPIMVKKNWLEPHTEFNGIKSNKTF